MTTTLEKHGEEKGFVEEPRNPRLLRLVIFAAIMGFTGAAGLIYEYVLSTVNSYLSGNSILQFSIVIGIMMLMMGIGGFLQKFIRGFYVELFIATELLLVLLGGFSPIIMQWAFATQQESFEAFKWIFVCIIGLLIGVEIPLVMHINKQFTRNLGDNIAQTWAWDYIGGAIGVVIWVILLKQYIPLTHISFIVAGGNLLVAFIAVAFFWKYGLLRWKIGGLIALVLTLAVTAITLFGWTSVNDWSKLINQKLYDDPIIFEASTPYQQITMTKGQHPTDPYDSNYELYLNGNKQFSSVDEHIYHELLVHPAMSAAASRKNVLVLGGGDGLAMREILKYPDVEHVTLVDLDPAMIEIARTNPVLTQLNEDSFDDARVNVDVSEGVIDTGQTKDVIVDTNQADSTECSIVPDGASGTRSECTTVPRTESIGTVDIYTVDADKFVSNTSGPWDVVIVDLPDPNSVELAKLYSAEFYGKIRQNMSADGIVVVQSTSPYHAKETFLCILRTMSAAGFGVTPYHANVPSFGDWGWVVGSPSLSDQRMHDSLEQAEFTVDTQEIDTQVLRSALTFNKTSLVSQNSSISTLMNPTIFQYYDYEGWKSE